MKVNETIWFKDNIEGLYMFEELKGIWYDNHPNERFDLGNFNAWADSKGFVRAN